MNLRNTQVLRAKSLATTALDTIDRYGVVITIRVSNRKIPGYRHI